MFYGTNETSANGTINTTNKKYDQFFRSLNRIALKMAKTQKSFGHSECNRVKETLLHSKWPKLKREKK